MARGWGVLIAAVAVLAVGVAPASAKPLRIKTLSNRADLVSSGDALVQVKGRGARRARVTLNGRDVTNVFAVRPDGRFTGLVTGLRDGRNVLRARRRDGSGARLVVTGHPNGGPVFAGPQVQPWVCQETAKDDQCNEPPQYTFEYKSSVDGQLKPYDPGSPPPDVATTTTDQGVTVPFVIRTETGYQDRDQYKIAVLYDPAQEWQPWAPQEQWNHKLLITHGASPAL